jgi:hypothetical protein
MEFPFYIARAGDTRGIGHARCFYFGMTTPLEMTMSKTLIAAATLAAVGLAGCVSRTIERETVTSPPPTTVVQTAPSQTTGSAPVVVASVAPPPPQQENIPPAPSADSTWIPGYWNWGNGQYSWVPGHYESGRVGYRWVPNRWENVNGQWQMTGGAWVRQ